MVCDWEDFSFRYEDRREKWLLCISWLTRCSVSWLRTYSTTFWAEFAENYELLSLANRVLRIFVGLPYVLVFKYIPVDSYFCKINSSFFEPISELYFWTSFWSSTLVSDSAAFSSLIELSLLLKGNQRCCSLIEKGEFEGWNSVLEPDIRHCFSWNLAVDLVKCYIGFSIWWLADPKETNTWCSSSVIFYCVLNLQSFGLPKSPLGLLSSPQSVNSTLTSF